MQRRRHLAALIFGLVLSLPLAAHAEGMKDFPGTKSIASRNWSFSKGVVPDWVAMLKRWNNGTVCESDTCTTAGWAEMVSTVKAAGDPLAQMKRANDLVNAHPYKEDIDNWHQAEYWATPYEFLKKSGDTEEYAIAKYFLLRAAGFPAETMQIAAVRITSQGGIGHALLLVQRDDRLLILDNRAATIMDANMVGKEFQMVMSLNEEEWWVYMPLK